MAGEEPVASAARWALAVGGALALAAGAQDQRPLPRAAPEALVAPGLQVSVEVDEALEPDRLRDLARPGVVAWVRTRSNTLAASTLENLARFDQAWVALAGGLSAHQRSALDRLPGVGAWVTLEDAPAFRSLRRLAVRVEGPLTEERLEGLQRLRPSVVQWRPVEPPDLLQWSLFRQVPGRRVLVASPALLLATRCEGGRQEGAPALELHLGELLALSSELFPCGRGNRVLLPPGVDRWVVQSLVVRDPSVELVLVVEADAAAALKARALLEALGTGEAR